MKMNEMSFCTCGKHWPCQGCGRCTNVEPDFERKFYSDVSNVTDIVWAEAQGGNGYLCVECIEARIGRKLHRLDFPKEWGLNQVTRCSSPANRRAKRRRPPMQRIDSAFSERAVLEEMARYARFVAQGRMNYPSGKRWKAMEEVIRTDIEEWRRIALESLEKKVSAKPRVPAVVGAPKYTSWDDYLAQVPEKDRRAWCAQKAKHTGRKREHLDGAAHPPASTEAVMRVMEKTRGRCKYCLSLALEKRPSGPDGRPASWDEVGRRIGSLDHIIPLVEGGDNSEENLAWCCLWCNTWPNERWPGATCHGAIQ